MFFRDQTLDHAAQIAFGAQFGDVTPGHPYEGDSAPPDFPQIHTVSPAAYDHRYGTKYRKKQSPNGPGWHADVTPLINPPSHSILRAEAVPPTVGTRSSSTSPRSTRAFRVGPRAHRRAARRTPFRCNSFRRSQHGEGRRPGSHQSAGLHPSRGPGAPGDQRTGGLCQSVLHPRDRRPRASREQARAGPAVRGDRPPRVRGALQVGAGKRRVLGQPRRAAPRAADFEHVEGDRVLHRITLVGDVPVGPDGRESESISGEFFGAA